MENKRICPRCGSSNALHYKYCDQCGSQSLPKESQKGDTLQARYCPHCGKKNPGAANNCVICGSNLTTGDPSGNTSQNPARGPLLGSSSYSQSRGSLLATRVDRLGQRLDGWADLIDGAADQVEMVRSTFTTDLDHRQLPRLEFTETKLTPGGVAGKRRTYSLAQSYTGATLAVYIGEFGRDLYVSWDLFLRPHIKWRNILIMLGVAAVLAIFPAIDAYSKFTRWFTGTIGGFLGICVLVAILGKILRGSAKAFFMEEIDHFAADDITATMFAVHHGLMKAIDEVGLDASLLRKKETFKAGRRERII